MELEGDENGGVGLDKVIVRKKIGALHHHPESYVSVGICLNSFAFADCRSSRLCSESAEVGGFYRRRK